MYADRPGWDFTDVNDCRAYHAANHSFPGHCNSTWDGFLCWPLTQPGTQASQPCPANVKGILKEKLAHRKCSENGFWLDGEGQESLDPSWTDFTGCFTPELTKVIEGFYANISETEAEQKASILYNARLFEMVGYSVSFLSILASLVILGSFRSLRTKEKRIHRHLYWAMLIQVVIRLILYTDQFVSRQSGAMSDHQQTVILANRNSSRNGTQAVVPSALGSSSPIQGIDNTPYLCEGFYVLLEYARSAMFHWFFIEGLHLHNVLTINVFPAHGNMRIYYLIGWGLPVIFTILWAITTGFSVDADCWYGYNHTNYYYIMEGPRLAVIVINFLFLLNILRVLLTKLRNNNSSETEQVRKAVKAAIVLQPLLGITNSLQMISTPYDQSVTYFAIWSFLTTFLVSFQGFFAALFYCFLNGEVRTVVGKYLDRRREERAINQRTSSFYHNNTIALNKDEGMARPPRRASTILGPLQTKFQSFKIKSPSTLRPPSGERAIQASLTNTQEIELNGFHALNGSHENPNKIPESKNLLPRMEEAKLDDDIDLTEVKRNET